MEGKGVNDLPSSESSDDDSQCRIVSWKGNIVLFNTHHPSPYLQNS